MAEKEWKCRCHNKYFKSKRSLAVHRCWIEGKLKPEYLKGINKGSLNAMWKGNAKLHTITLHEWVRNNIGVDKICKCGATENIDLANITGIYERDFSNWEYMCRKCHMRSDNRIYNLKQYQGVIYAK